LVTNTGYVTFYFIHKIARSQPGCFISAHYVVASKSDTWQTQIGSYLSSVPNETISES
jgi:hypothetical protein